MSKHQSEVGGIPLGMAEMGHCHDPEQRRSNEVIWAPEEWSRSSPRLGPKAELAPVAMTGSLVGSVVDRHGLLTQVRLLVRDRKRAVVRECYLVLSRTGSAGVRFEVRGLPADTYTLEVRAPDCCREVRHGVRVEATCVTDVGIVRLVRPNVPRIAAALRHEGIRPPFLPLPSRRARLRNRGIGLLNHARLATP